VVDVKGVKFVSPLGIPWNDGVMVLKAGRAVDERAEEFSIQTKFRHKDS
jgi:hypothetical protein